MLNIEISAEKIFTLWHLPITNTLLMSWVVALLLIIVSQVVSRQMKLIPTFFQNIVESAVEALLGFMEKTLQSREKAEKYFPFIATIFTLVLVSNWLGIVPGIGSVGFNHVVDGHQVFVPLLRSLASDLNFTLAIAIISVVMTNVYAVASKGIGKHVSHFISFKNPISFFVGILEFISEIAKMISFSFRLFGNVFAGEVLLIITGFLAPYLIPVPFLMLELFVGFIQSLVFATLTLVFISIAIEDHTEEHAQA